MEQNDLYKPTRQEWKKLLVDLEDQGPQCRNCQTWLILRQHEKPPEPYSNRPRVYFKRWKFCQKCKAVFFDERDRVVLPASGSRVHKTKAQWDKEQRRKREAKARQEAQARREASQLVDKQRAERWSERFDPEPRSSERRPRRDRYTPPKRTI